MNIPVSLVPLQHLARILGTSAATAILLAVCSDAAAVDLAGARQILLPVGDVSADPSWSLYSGDESYARSLQDVSTDLSRNDGLGTAALAAAGGVGDTLTVRLKSGAPPSGARLGDHIVHVWARAVRPSGATFRVALLQGETVLWLSGLWNATTRFQELTKTVPQSAALSITDYQDLRLRFYSQGRPFYLSKAYLEVGEDQAPDLSYPDNPVWDGNVNVVQYEVDPLATGVSWAEDRGAGRSGKNQRQHLLEITGGVVGGRLQLTWIYSQQVHKQETVERVATEFVAALQQLIEQCQWGEVIGFTPSDFPEAELSQQELDELVAELS